MRNTLIVGRNSFLAQRFMALARAPDSLRAVPHTAAFDRSIYRDVRCVINFAIHPDYRRRPVSPSTDFDAQLAAMFAGSAPAEAHYVMLSSRTVYAPEMAPGAREDVAGDAPTVYGRNKRRTEQKLQEILGDRATLLRIANVIGDEHGLGRTTFMGLALDRLVSHGEIILDISPTVCRDFLPDHCLARILESVIAAPIAGPLNVGAGLPIAVGAIAQWIIEGYGTGEVRVLDDRRHDEFWLDTTKLRERYGFTIDAAQIAEHCRQIGARLRRRVEQSRRD